MKMFIEVILMVGRVVKPRLEKTGHVRVFISNEKA